MPREFLFAGIVILVAAIGEAASAQTFTPCEDAASFPELAGSVCVLAPAPLDHEGGDGGEGIELFVRKFPAAGEAKGQIWLVAGGPGESGASFYPFLDTLRRSFPGYDLIVPDHRGTGYSSKLCPVEEAPESPDGIALAGEEWEGCIGALHQDPARAGFFSITQAARDLSMLIERYRGQGAVYVYGVSYGTQLVLRTMQAAPPRVDGLILDSLVPPERTDRWDLSRRTSVTDEVGRSFLDDRERAAYARLLRAADASPPWLDRVPGRDLKGFMGALLDLPELRMAIPIMVDELLSDDTATLDRTLVRLNHLSARFSRYPQSPSSLPLVMVISGSENSARPGLTPTMVAEEATSAWFTSPLPGYLAANPMPLYGRDGLFGGVPDQLPSTLVLHGTRDPKTPYAGALARIEALPGADDIRLMTVEGAPHFILFTAPDCFEAAASAFVDGGVTASRCVIPGVDENGNGT